MDTLALGAAVVGASFGAEVCYLAVKRQWWKAIEGFAIGSAILLTLVADGVHSRLENRAAFIATMILLAGGLAALVADVTRRTG